MADKCPRSQCRGVLLPQSENLGKCNVCFRFFPLRAAIAAPVSVTHSSKDEEIAPSPDTIGAKDGTEEERMALTEEEKKKRKKEYMKAWRDSLTPEQMAERRKRVNERYHARRNAADPKKDREAFLEEKRQKKILADRAYRAQKKLEKDVHPPICDTGRVIQGPPVILPASIEALYVGMRKAVAAEIIARIQGEFCE